LFDTSQLVPIAGTRFLKWCTCGALISWVWSISQIKQWCTENPTRHLFDWFWKWDWHSTFSTKF